MDRRQCSAAQLGVSRLAGGNVLFSMSRAGDRDIHSLLEVFEALLWDSYPVVNISFLQRVSRKERIHIISQRNFNHLSANANKQTKTNESKNLPSLLLQPKWWLQSSSKMGFILI